MKNYKGNMLLIELAIVLLFFSLSQVVIVQLFASAQEKTNESRILREAMVTAQDVAEQLNHETRPEAVLMRLGFMGGNGTYILSNEAGFDLLVSIEHKEQTAGQLITSTLTAVRNNEELFALPSVYYEAKGAQP